MFNKEFKESLKTLGTDIFNEVEKRISQNNEIEGEIPIMNEPVQQKQGTLIKEATHVEADIVESIPSTKEETSTKEDISQKCNLKVTDKCMKCGSCLGCGLSFLASSSDGSIVVQPGTILDKNSNEFKMLKDICPVDAFLLDESVGLADKKSILKSLVTELKNYKGVSVPTADQFKFKKEDYSISYPTFANGEYRYDYPSHAKANSAAQREFESRMYSQIDSYILKVITEYRVKLVKPYYTSELSEGSVYAKSNQKVSEILKAIKDTYDGQLPNDFATVEIMPNRDDIWKMLNKGEAISDGLVSAVKSQFDYSASSYDMYWNTDDKEVWIGTNRRGDSKYKDKYCYYDVAKAFKALADDLLDACYWASDDIEWQAENNASYLVEIYNESLKQFIEEKLKYIKL